MKVRVIIRTDSFLLSDQRQNSLRNIWSRHQSKWLEASVISQNGKGFCLQKSILFVAIARSLVFPSRLKCGHVKNHLASDDVLELMEGSVFLHWFTEIKMNNTWISSTPVFSKFYCMIFNQTPLEFDGKSDSVHQAFNHKNTMEFLALPVLVNPNDAMELVHMVRKSHPNMLDDNQIVKKTKFKEGV